MTSKQRAYLRSLANSLEPIFQVGKSGPSPELVKAIDEALEARELIKINILKNCFDEPRDICNVICERTRSEGVQVIGRKIVIYRMSKENPKIMLP
ncbi:ribosome assembly RNA-binding protein YhbY [Vallitalea okinawensis]|uniref:ribosome assembly RNA-binding protein YhbY n=1 Tax=Vallitalea okinawensis TaxID=2078660 RepID=UPI000CFAF13E|nr:ribosome assembly RNA-binding protein YhbY [Vallitalea okinawensis]